MAAKQITNQARQKPEVDRESKLYRDIVGRVQKIHYNDKGFVICKVEIVECAANPAAKGMTIVCKGSFSPVLAGCLYTIQGMLSKYERNAPNRKPISEWQLLVSFWRQVGNQDRDALVAFLVQECQGIGPCRANEIYDAFGKNSLATLRDDPVKVATVVKGLSTAAAQTISQTIKANEMEFRFKEYLYGIGLTQGLAAKLYAYYGTETEKAVKERTFELSEVDGIGFRTCCLIADKIGIPKDRCDRVRAGILYTVNELMQGKGCTCLQVNLVAKETAKTLDVDENVVRENLMWLLKDGKLLPDTCTFDEKLFENQEPVTEDCMNDDIDPKLLKKGIDWSKLKRSMKKGLHEPENPKPEPQIGSQAAVDIDMDNLPDMPAVTRLFESVDSISQESKEGQHGYLPRRGLEEGRNSSEANAANVSIADSRSAQTIATGPAVGVKSLPPPQLTEPQKSEEFELILDDDVEACRESW